MRTLRILALALLTLLAAPAAGASAAPPPNDDRTTAQAVPALPADIRGTLVEATATGPDEGGAAAVWYRYVAATDGRFTASFKATGDLDAQVAAFRQVRSQVVFLDAEDSDEKGEAALSFRVKAGQTVLIRVSRRPGSVADRFALLLSAAAPEVKPPGSPLGRGGVTSTLDRVLRPAEAYSYTMREGVTYRVNVVPVTPPKSAQPTPDPAGDEAADEPPEPTCSANVALYAPGTTDFDEDTPQFVVGCDAYRLFTPARREGGRYVFRAFTGRGARGPQRYHLQVAPAGPNDTAPGVFLANQRTTPGALAAGGINRVDLYRFQLKSRSRLKLSLAGPDGLGMKLRNDRGRLIEEGAAINREIAPGRYFVAIQATAGTRGRYRLRRSSRTITRSSISISGVARARGRLGATLSVGVRLRPAVGGPIRVTFQRFDPEAGWLFLRSVDVRASNGSARLGFRPPAVGRFRAKAVYLGTKAAAGSETGFANVLVTAGGD